MADMMSKLLRASRSTARGDSTGAVLGPGAMDITVNSVVHPDGTESMVYDDGALRIRHRELIGTCYAWSEFSSGILPGPLYQVTSAGDQWQRVYTDHDPVSVNESYYINPGFETTFPWLSKIAKNFQEYSMLGLVFEYVARSSSQTYQTSGATNTGTIVFTTQYNCNDPAFVSKSEAENSSFTCIGNPYQNIYHPVECDPSQLPLSTQYVWHVGDMEPSNVTTANTSLSKFYHLGRTTVFVQGAPGINGSDAPELIPFTPADIAAGWRPGQYSREVVQNSVLGDIYVTYDVLCKKAISRDTVAFDSGLCEFVIQKPADLTDNPSYAFSRGYQVLRNLLDCKLCYNVTDQSNVITFPEGVFSGLAFGTQLQIDFTLTGYVPPATVVALPQLNVRNLAIVNSIGIVGEYGSATVPTVYTCSIYVSLVDPSAESVLSVSGTFFPVSSVVNPYPPYSNVSPVCSCGSLTISLVSPNEMVPPLFVGYPLDAPPVALSGQQRSAAALRSLNAVVSGRKRKLNVIVP